MKRKTAWVEPSKGRFPPLSTSPSLFFFPAALTLCRIPNFKRLEQARAKSAASSIYNTYPRTLNLQHWRNAVSLRYINRAEITVFMFELVVRFLCRRQIYLLHCEHNLKFPVSNANKRFNQSCYFL